MSFDHDPMSSRDPLDRHSEDSRLPHEIELDERAVCHLFRSTAMHPEDGVLAVVDRPAHMAYGSLVASVRSMTPGCVYSIEALEAKGEALPGYDPATVLEGLPRDAESLNGVLYNMMSTGHHFEIALTGPQSADPTVIKIDEGAYPVILAGMRVVAGMTPGSKLVITALACPHEGDIPVEPSAQERGYIRDGGFGEA